MVSQPFVSTTINKLDAKRRVSVPAAFRQILAKQDLQGFYCLPLESRPALEAFGTPVLAHYQERQAAAEPLHSTDYDVQAQEVFGECRLLEFDDQGRVTLPPELQEHAGITERVLFVGLNQKFQIWDPERFEKIRQERLARARAARESRTMNGHIPVMLEEVMAVLRPRDDAIYVDGTFGGGGYSEALLSRAQCRVFAIDRDPDAIERGAVLARRFGARLTLIHGRFSEMHRLLGAHGVSTADGVALDIGVSSFQLEDEARGFSFASDAPLDMRMDRSRGKTAAELCNTLPEPELAALLREYGEENRAKQIARAIVAARPVVSTRQLAEIIERVAPRRGQKIHPATRSFQALRIAVNDELGELERGLTAAQLVLTPGARLAVVSFHSLEDRIVKQFLIQRFRSYAAGIPAYARMGC